MPSIPYHLLPRGARWFASKGRAIAHGAVLAEIRTAPNSTFYGAYKDQPTLCSHAMEYVREAHPPAIQAQVATLAMEHHELSPKHCAELKLPPGGRWFIHETGALTAYTLQEDAFFVKTLLKMSEKTSKPFYAIFASAREWDAARNHLHRAYSVPDFPFQTGTLEYDRCRCTLMHARGALHRPPRLHRLTNEDMLTILAFVPHCDFWFATKEDALDMAGYTVEFATEVSKRYAVFKSQKEFAEALHTYRKIPGYSSTWDRFSLTIVSDPEGHDTRSPKSCTSC